MMWRPMMSPTAFPRKSLRYSLSLSYTYLHSITLLLGPYFLKNINSFRKDFVKMPRPSEKPRDPSPSSRGRADHTVQSRVTCPSGTVVGSSSVNIFPLFFFPLILTLVSPFHSPFFSCQLGPFPLFVSTENFGRQFLGS